jgi:ribonuclease HI
MPWQRMFFRNDAVFVLVGDDGRPVVDSEGRAEMKYRESDSKTYRPGPSNLSVDPGGAASRDPSRTKVAHEKGVKKPTVNRAHNGNARSGNARVGDTHAGHAAGGRQAHDESALQVWTDGACSGNPGPMGIGVVVIDGHEREEIGEYLGKGTNNIAELVAIERGLDAVIKRISSTTQRVRIHSDSSYAIGLLDKGWKAKANQDVVERIRRKLAAFPAAVTFVKVAGHAGVAENERCDELAREAVERRASLR